MIWLGKLVEFPHFPKLLMYILTANITVSLPYKKFVLQIDSGCRIVLHIHKLVVLTNNVYIVYEAATWSYNENRNKNKTSIAVGY